MFVCSVKSSYKHVVTIQKILFQGAYIFMPTCTTMEICGRFFLPPLRDLQGLLICKCTSWCFEAVRT